MALDKLTKVQSVGISSFIQVVGVVTATGGFVGDVTGTTSNASGATGDFSIADKIVHTGDTDTAMRFPADNTFAVDTAGSERLRITSTGAVQITGVDDQDNLLVKSNNTHFAIHQDDSDGEVSLRAQDGSGSNNTKYMTFFTEGGSGPTERLRITSAGDVKIKSFGNASNASADALQIGKTDNNYGITILSATNAQGRIDFTDTEDTNDPQGKIAYYHDSNSLQFFTNGAAASNERFRIRSDGKISAGTAINTTNTYEFSVTGADGTGGFYAHGRNHYLSNRSNAYSSLTLKKANADSDGIDYLQLRDSSNTLKGQITGAGNWKPISGGGIDFSADGNASGMTSELLDDYEEGNFTPIVRGRTTAGTASYGRTAVGKYTKVGRMVSVMVDMVFSSANGNGNIEIAGLPFAAHSGPYVRFAGDVTLLTAGISWSNQIACYINDTNSHFWITNTPTSGNYTFVNINSNTTEILLHCTYMVS